ncbi:hypothetical protein K4F52_007668 [Lecanicillium sp. MT-2017a]|nr:hypothetical protein K4F52_007668 [Lecanicillium sp. MT-2017a]
MSPLATYHGPLSRACEKGELGIMRPMEGRQDGTTDVKNLRYTPVITVLMYFKDEAQTKSALELLFSYGATLPFYEIHDVMTPLHVAAWHGRKPMAEYLLSKGADANALNEDGNGPLELAIKHERVEVVKLLLNNSAAVEWARLDRVLPWPPPESSAKYCFTIYRMIIYEQVKRLKRVDVALDDRKLNLEEREKGLKESEEILEERLKLFDENETTFAATRADVAEAEKALQKKIEAVEEREAILEEREKAFEQKERACAAVKADL